MIHRSGGLRWLAGFLTGIAVATAIGAKAVGPDRISGRTGPEWEFTNPQIDAASDEDFVTSGAIERVRRQLIKKILEKCPSCEREDFYNKYGTDATRIHFPDLDYFYLDINTDPGTVEVQAAPTTLDGWRRVAPYVQYTLFDSAAELGIEANPNYSAGHIHFSVQDYFGENATHFVNFVVDFMNHEELSSGVLEFDHDNAPPLSVVGQGRIEVFNALLRQFKVRPMSIEEFSRQMQSTVYDVTANDGWAPPKKFHDLCLIRVADGRLAHSSKSLEVRSISGQRTMKEFMLIVELFEARINYVRQFKEIIPYTPRNGANMTDAEREARFKQYVTEAGLEWDRFKILLADYDDEEAISMKTEVAEILRGSVPSVRAGSKTVVPINLPWKSLGELHRRWRAQELDADSARQLARTLVARAPEDFRNDLAALFQLVKNGPDDLGEERYRSIRLVLESAAASRADELEAGIRRHLLTSIEERRGLRAWRALLYQIDRHPALARVLKKVVVAPELSVLRSWGVNAVRDGDYWYSDLLLAGSSTREDRRRHAVWRLRNMDQSRIDTDNNGDGVIRLLLDSPYRDVRDAAVAYANSRYFRERALKSHPQAEVYGRLHRAFVVGSYESVKLEALTGLPAILTDETRYFLTLALSDTSAKVRLKAEEIIKHQDCRDALLAG